MLILGVPLCALGLDAAVTAAVSTERRSVVIEASPGVRDADTWDAAFATVFLNGLGLDISGQQALALAPSVGRYGRVLGLEYAEVFDPNEAADALAEGLMPDEDSPRPVYLAVAASSMGDVRGLEIIASLTQRQPDVRVMGFIVNTGPGPRKRVRVRGGATVQAVIDRSCSAFIPGRVTLGLLEVLNQSAQGRLDNSHEVAVAYRAGTTYRGGVVFNQLCSLTRPSAVDAPPPIPYTVYLTTGDPADDRVVDTDGAYRDWVQVLPGMQRIRVPGATHDNFSFRPDLFNPLFANEIMPRIRAQQIVRSPATRPNGLGAQHPV